MKAEFLVFQDILWLEAAKEKNVAVRSVLEKVKVLLEFISFYFGDGVKI